ncbi:MAG: response regulator [Candidatus Omnitrophota bacterium]
MPKKILLVDDDPAVHFIVAPILTKEGYRVISAKQGEQGLLLALNERPDLIILDVIMPGIVKGRELCIKIKAYDVLKNIPVVFLTAKDSEDDIRAELDAGAVTHLTKPIDAAQVVSVIKGILGS